MLSLGLRLVFLQGAEPWSGIWVSNVLCAEECFSSPQICTDHFLGHRADARAPACTQRRGLLCTCYLLAAKAAARELPSKPGQLVFGKVLALLVPTAHTVKRITSSALAAIPKPKKKKKNPWKKQNLEPRNCSDKELLYSWGLAYQTLLPFFSFSFFLFFFGASYPLPLHTRQAGAFQDFSEISKLFLQVHCSLCTRARLASGAPRTKYAEAPLMATEEHGPTTLKEMQVDEVPKLQPPKPNWYERYVQPCVAELLGSALFIFIGCASVIENVEGTGRLQPALAHGLALGLSIAVLGNISGGHFNPAVSLGAWLVGALHITMLLPYWVSQLCGGVIGAALAKAATAGERYANASGGAVGSIAADGQVPAALAGEIVMTAFLVLAVCMGALNEKTRTPLAPFCIGFTVTADILAGGAVSGACMNPARAFGPALVANYWDYHWVYWVGPVIGGLIVGALVRLLLGDRKTRLLLL
uniref:Aquaporin-8 n=1 Tax=Apteryx owenii TaxID=8824 RepID=A0A8B9P718_APTOW